MSPAIPSRPSMEGRKLSEKARNSPVVVRHTPKKTNQPPMKLEVGQGAFYFSIELPPSKITTKKSGTTSKSGTPKGGETPTRSRTPSPLKNASPTKENAAGTPTRTTRSPLKRRETIHHDPARPLFGTPTRMMTPKQNTDPQTPTRRTPSPRKTCSSMKQSPATPAVGTPKRKILGETPGSSRPGSPVKRSIEQDDLPTDLTKTSSLSAKKLRAESKETRRKPINSLVNIEREHAPKADAVATAITNVLPHPESIGQVPTAKVCPENIGHLMASLISNTNSTHDWASSHKTDIISPAPTPLRKAGEKLKLGESPSFLRMSANVATAIKNEDPAANVIKMGSLAPHRPASTEPRQHESKPIARLSSGLFEDALSSSVIADRTTDLDHAADVSNEPRPTHPLRATKSLGTLKMTRKVPDPPHRPLRSETQRKDSCQQENQTTGQGMDKGQPKPSLPVFASQHRRVGTDPSVLLKMQKDMVNLGATMRRSAGFVDPAFCGPLNLNELPAMPNDLFVRDQQDIRSPGAVGTPQTLSRANSDNLSLGAVQVIGAKVISNPVASSRVSSVPRIPRWKPGGPMPSQAKGDHLTTAKQTNSQPTGTDMKVALGRPRPRAGSAVSGSAVSGPRKSNVVTSTPRRKTLGTPVKQTVPLGARTRGSPHSRIPSLTSIKAESTTPPVPKIPRKHLPSTSSNDKAVKALRERLPNVPSAPVNTRPVPTRKPLGPSATEPYNPSTDPRPYEQKFASAGDIADRLAGWHNEDRKKMQADRPTVPTRPLNKTPAKTPLRTQPNESTTPDGSPNKTFTPTAVSAATKPPKPLSTKPPAPSTPKRKPTTPAPKTPAPKTPALGARKAAVNDHRQPITAGAKTPVNRRIPVLDPNATRTPSKAIVSSLDAAIDRKIAEDARRGLELRLEEIG